ncbi:JHBP domain containing protein [Asbolus verrucosus]|uniref:JHBP domain containing protein n=1 Tax=Asbolus verrucosus TaxID=1661398 RepID=A0A482VX73_ASBVE|nr:JHBP domain containing protein [Asbolus verrucosus]
MLPENLKADCLLGYEEVKRRDKTHIRFVSSKLDIDPSLMSFEFENLFDGERELGDNINKVLNDNWKEVFADVKNDYIELVNQILLGLMNKFFDKVSLEEAFDN